MKSGGVLPPWMEKCVIFWSPIYRNPRVQIQTQDHQITVFDSIWDSE